MATAPKHATSSIKSIEVSACTIPTDFPESDGTLEWDKTTIVLVEAKSGEIGGIGYTYADASTAKLIDSLLRTVVEGRDAMDVAGAWLAMTQAIRNLGRPGIASMAISAVDIALWDLKAKLLRLPLVKLLGAVRNRIPVYGSGGFTSYPIDRLQRQLSDWVKSGIRMVKMKIGRQANDDPTRVLSAREAIGNDAGLSVDANGAYSRKQALQLAERFREANVSWFEEPVSSDDLEGLRFIREQAPKEMEIAAGEYGYDARYFRTMLESGAVDVLQADATRCGGITGFLQAGALCAAHSTPISAHTAPSIHKHVCCAVTSAVHVEYFYDHVRIENLVFDGVQQPQNGCLIPDATRFGLGLEIRRADIEKYAIR
ncbi:MAG TPA: enolase C-terminal domain-like protein [Candidatus Acidoferrales bacterium]|nr:enolase C-terminal domain-like protein [Candidatus Acidoferrales bacterium]